MAKVYLICGKICSGKSYYTASLLKRHSAVLLSCDELARALFEYDLGEKHDETLAKIKRYLLNKAVDIVNAGCDAVLDWGFWSAADRHSTSNFFSSRGIVFEWHYIEIGETEWQKNIADRNAAVLCGRTTDYYVDQCLVNKLLSFFEEPKKEEIDVWYINRRQP